MSSTKTIEICGEIRWMDANGQLHREDSPAVENAYGFQNSCKWYVNGKLHRMNGPALIFPSGYEYWYVCYKHVPVKSQEEFEQYLRLLAFV